MNYAAILFLFLVAATLAYTAARLGLSIYLDFRGAGEVRRQLLQRLRLLPLRPVLAGSGLNPQEALFRYPLHEVERLIRACEACPRKRQCEKLLAGGRGGPGFCPVKTEFIANN
jgi:hypothetical protein